ncbi:MAG: DUF1302 family protein [Syntrophales bacterium]
MKAKFWLTKKWLLIFPILFLSVMEAKAEVQLSDTLSVTGLLRQELAVNTAEKNPNNGTQADRNSIKLSRSFFHTEWTYEPNDTFKVFSKVKVISDQTQGLDNNLNDYDAFPLATPRYGTYLRATNDSEFNVEMSELYAEVSLGNLWLRLGKQQIVWGEVIGGRILDQINPLDQSWHLTLEPEEFENVRIAEWALRGRYEFSQWTGALQWLRDFYLEGFVNPGDISPTISPVNGSPYNLKAPASPVFKIREEDRRGDMEFGFRIGGSVGQFAGTLNYLSLYTDSGFWESRAPLSPGPPSPTNPFPTTVSYPRTDMYGASLNYAFPYPINTTVTYEGIYSPDEPYYDKASALPLIRTAHTLKQAIIFARNTFVLPRPIAAMSIQFQYMNFQIWDNDQIKVTPAPFSSGSSTTNNNIDGDQHIIVLSLSQKLFKGDLITLSFQAIYDLDDAYQIKPGFTYKPGDHWVFDIYGAFLGGTESRPGRLGYLSWNDEVFGRITYQF